LRSACWLEIGLNFSDQFDVSINYRGEPLIAHLTSPTPTGRLTAGQSFEQKFAKKKSSGAIVLFPKLLNIYPAEIII
jgi:hypothetical protein